MMNLEVTAFHLDFSTLDIERGKTDIVPSGSTTVIQPTVFSPEIKVEGVLIDEKGDGETSVFTKADFEGALRKVGRRTKK